MGRAWGVSLDFVITILAGAGVGWLLGKYLLGHPVGYAMGGLALGFAVAFVRIIRYTQSQERQEAERKQRGG